MSDPLSDLPTCPIGARSISDPHEHAACPGSPTTPGNPMCRQHPWPLVRRTGDGVVRLESSGPCQCGAVTARRLYDAWRCVTCVPVYQPAPGLFGAGYRPARRA